MSQIKVNSDCIADTIISLRLLLEKCRDQSNGHGCFNHPLSNTSGKCAEMLDNLTQELDITKNRIDIMIEHKTIEWLITIDARFRAADEAMRNYIAAGGARGGAFYENPANRQGIIDAANKPELLSGKTDELKRLVPAGTGVDVDGWYGYQCWDLSKYYMKNVLGLPGEPVGGSGIEGLVNWAQNNGWAVDKTPQAGDIFFTDSYGHTGVVISAGPPMVCYEQNVGTGGGGGPAVERRYPPQDATSYSYIHPNI
jgi:hypothetical protein